MANSLRFTVEVQADKATESLNAVSLALNKAGIDGRVSLGKLLPAANEAQKGVEGLAGAIRGYASEQRSQNRVGSFFVRELADLTPLSNTAKTAIGGLSAALVGGFGAGFAFELALTGIKTVVELMHQEEEALKAAREEAKRHAEAMDKIAGIQSKTTLLGMSPGNVHDTVDLYARTGAELRKLTREYRDLEDQRDKAVKDRNPTGVLNAQRRMDELKAERQAVIDQRTAEEKRLDNESTVAVTKAEHAVVLARNLSEEERIRVEYDQRIAEVQEEIRLNLKSEVLGNLEINRLLEERKNKLQAIIDRQQRARYLNPYGGPGGFGELDYGAAGGKGWENYGHPEHDDHYDPLPWAQKEEGGASNAFGAMPADQFAMMVSGGYSVADVNHSILESAKKNQEAYQHWGQVASDAIAGMILDGKSLEDELKNIINLLARLAISYGISSLIPGAGAGAGVETPGIGPVSAPIPVGATVVNVNTPNAESFNKDLRNHNSGVVAGLKLADRRRRVN